MNPSVETYRFGTVLVPVDFSAPSLHAYRRALRLVSGDTPVVIVLHSIDPSLVESVVSYQFGSRDNVVERIRQRANERLEEIKKTAPDHVEVDVLISQGTPFLEILRKADDFAVDAIVMGKIGMRGSADKLLFGSTAEKVLRGTQHPVLVFPSLD